ncbi:right-handed parallel beta-helix repeat-containing protein [Methanospirillum sp. J.3.6.1-F.2.7.3]|uniref:Right-handed parallel beta-helix repeat-containing protein n=1 Tax=Methanospirillum purgamenti TaxID=2834276 RepID=A0A8E7EJN8_9EURY|nr:MULTISPECIES: NosD domain-containing protein [Methanospirillum]MDX8549141.1 CARDB domain-containing protein [Methanospirillum hungatei]QVV88816.1 right-handed parallel beta-helix repeat-containing protein [Methanospirillum sp. J.3.6.1-F.2.7.3]
MKYKKESDIYQKKYHIERIFLSTLFFISIICWFGTCGVCAEDNIDENLESGPDVAILDASVKMDISEMGEIPLGTIPEERLVVTITVQNTGNREAPGFKLRAYLVRVGREDEIGTQIGGDVTDTRLAAGETRTYTKSWSLPSHLKKGEYRVMIVLDTSNYFIEPDTDNNRIIGPQSIVPGALSGPEGSIPVYSAADITEPGYYVLKRDIDGGKKVNIFQIKSSGVTFDGGGNTIRGGSSGFTTGIYVDAGTAIKDVVIKNLKIEGVDAGIWTYKVSNGVITNCTLRNMVNMGVRLDQSNQNQVYNNIFEQNSIGIGVFQSKDNVIYNNLFKNKHNAVVNEDQRNKWNTDLKAGTNIIGGSMVGGNAWFDESGEGGFSKTAEDYTLDGISDAPYSLNPNNIDLYPLSTSPSKTVPSITPVPEPTFLPNITDLTLSNGTDEENKTVSDGETLSEILPEINESETITEPEPEIPDETDSVPEESSTIVSEIPEPESTKSSLSPYADISVKEVTGPQSGCPGTEFSFSTILENSGGYDADSFQVRYYLTEDKQVDPQDILLGEKSVKNLLSGSEQTINETFNIPQLIGLKNYFVAVVTNTDNSVFEDKNDNNTGFSSVRMAIREC